MEITTRKVFSCLEVEVFYDHTTFSLGLLDCKEAKALLSTLQSAVEDLEWFINTTEDVEGGSDVNPV
jgi:hypothetical protein